MEIIPAVLYRIDQEDRLAEVRMLAHGIATLIAAVRARVNNAMGTPIRKTPHSKGLAG